MSLSVLVVDDTVVYRKLLSDVLAQLGITEVTVSASGPLALNRMKLNRYDLALVDIEMPEMNGIELLTQIKQLYPAVEVVMISSTTTKGAEITIDALKKGALEFVPKPSGSDAQTNFNHLLVEIGNVLNMVKRRKGIRTECVVPAPVAPAAPAAQPVRPVPSKRPDSFAVTVIGVSTGGPKALADVIPQLPADYPTPILLVQHMPPKFTEALARDLDSKSKLKVVEARDGEPIETGKVYIAPGGLHMVARMVQGVPQIGITDGPPENSCRPAADVLFRSVADVYGTQGILALVMTGMGSDGMKGVRTIRRKPSYCITQSQKSCVVYGMPMAVDQEGLSDESVDLNGIAQRMTTLTARKNFAVAKA